MSSARPRPAPGPAEPGNVLAAIADPTRRQLLAALASSGSATATELAGGLPVTRQAIAKHLSVLKRASLVTSQRHGRDVRFTVQTGGLARTAGWIEGLVAEWDSRLAANKRIAETPE